VFNNFKEHLDLDTIAAEIRDASDQYNDTYDDPTLSMLHCPSGSMDLGAAKLVSEFQSSDSFDLSVGVHLEQLCPKVASELSQVQGMLQVVGLRILTQDTAEQLCQHRGELLLEVCDASESALAALSQHQGTLALIVLGTLSDSAATQIRRHPRLKLNVFHCSDLTAESLCGTSFSRATNEPTGRVQVQVRRRDLVHEVHFRGVTKLTVSMAQFARILEYHDSVDQVRTCICLNQLEAIEESVLSKSRLELHVNRLSLTAAQQLVAVSGMCTLMLDSLTGEVAEVLANIKALRLHLTNEDIPSDVTLAKLSHSGAHVLALDGLQSISDEAAATLSRYQCQEISLNGLTNISDTAVKSLSQFQGRLTLNGLTTISETAVKLMSELHRCPQLPIELVETWLCELSGLTRKEIQKIEDFHASALVSASLRRQDRTLTLKSLNDELAEAAANFKGDLRFAIGQPENLEDRTLSESAAESLSRHQKRLFIMNPRLVMSDQAARSLSKHSGELHLNVRVVEEHREMFGSNTSLRKRHPEIFETT